MSKRGKTIVGCGVLITALLSASIATANQNVIVVVDDSGSMLDRMKSGTSRIQAAKQALRVVLSNLPADAQAGVLALNQGWILPLQSVDRNQLSHQIDRLDAGGGTPLGSCFKMAADELLTLRGKQIYGDYRLLVVTDGEANDRGKLDAALADVLSRGITVDVIGVDMQADHSLATRVHNYRRADDPSSLEQAIAASLAESDTQAGDLAGEESDFELIAGLPDGMATTILTTLTTADNTPVTEGQGQPAPDFSSAFPNASNSPGASGGGGGGGMSMGLMLCLGILFFGVTTISAMLKAGRRR